MEKVSFKVVLDKRRKNEEKIFPLTLRTTFQRKRYYAYAKVTGLGESEPVHKMSATEYENIFKQPKKREHKHLLAEFNSITDAAHEVAKSISPFNYNLFKRLLLGKGESGEVLAEFKIYMDNLYREDRYGSYESYRSASKAIERFDPKVKFSEIDKVWLQEFEKWMTQKEGKSMATVGFYMRSLKAVFNQAREKNLVKVYPFRSTLNPKGYTIQSGRNAKKGEVSLLRPLESEGSSAADLPDYLVPPGEEY